MNRTPQWSLGRFLLCGFAICASACADNITYFGSFTTANNTVDYTITTDGVLGVLAISDIVSVSMSDTGTLAFSTTLGLTGLGYSFIDPGDLVSTATTLVYLPPGAPLALLAICDNDCDHNIEFGVTADRSLYVEDVSNAGLGVESTALTALPPSGLVIAQTPEPGTLLPMLGGSLILGLAAWKRRRQALRS